MYSVSVSWCQDVDEPPLSTVTGWEPRDIGRVTHHVQTWPTGVPVGLSCPWTLWLAAEDQDAWPIRDQVRQGPWVRNMHWPIVTASTKCVIWTHDAAWHIFSVVNLIFLHLLIFSLFLFSDFLFIPLMLFFCLLFLRVYLIGSTPGRYLGSDMDRWGHLRLRKILTGFLTPFSLSFLVSNFFLLFSLCLSSSLFCSLWLHGAPALSLASMFNEALVIIRQSICLPPDRKSTRLNSSHL